MRIAILDTNPERVAATQKTLDGTAHFCHVFHADRDLLQQLRRETFDLMVLGCSTPNDGGLGMLRRVRENVPPQLPVIVLSDEATENDIISTLNAGADDYLVDPISQPQLLARINTLLRRAYQPVTEHSSELWHGYSFDLRTQTVTFAKRTVTLTQKEFDLALLLFKHLARPLSRSHILEQVWGRNIDIPSRTLDTHVSRIRTKLCLHPESGFRLAPVYSYGYRLEKLSEPNTLTASNDTVADNGDPVAEMLQRHAKKVIALTTA